MEAFVRGGSGSLGVETSAAKMHNVSTEGASPGGRRLSRSFHSCLRGADHDDLDSGRIANRTPVTGVAVKFI